MRSRLCKHIIVNAENKAIWLDTIGGYYNHFHCLVSSGREQTISKIAQLIKGESSLWLNKYFFNQEKFQWQDDYRAVGISESNLKHVQKYILNQENDHRKYSFEEETGC